MVTHSPRSARPRRLVVFAVVRYLFLVVMTLVTLVPFVYMVAISFSPSSDAMHIPVYWIPPHPTLDNYRPFFESGLNSPLLHSLANSVFVASASTLAVLTVDALAAFGFARLRLPGTNVIFAIILLSLMVPVQVTLIPIFLLMRDLHFLNTYNALVWPAAAGAFGVFLLRQFFQAIPAELEEAAAMDGATMLRIFWSVDLPMVKNALVTLAVLTWLASWNDFFWPLIALSRDDMFTAPVEITALNFAPNQALGPLMAAAVLVAAPPLIFYVIFQRRITAAVMTTGLAGR
jgi:multiple sugar transport system permease protein